MKSIDIIEPAISYFLLSIHHRDSGSKPILVGGRLKLTYALQDVPSDMIVATTGNDKRCVILIDYTEEEIRMLIQKADSGLLKIKAKN